MEIYPKMESIKDAIKELKNRSRSKLKFKLKIN